MKIRNNLEDVPEMKEVSSKLNLNNIFRNNQFVKDHTWSIMV
jgi:hypothetical protein